MSTWPLLQRNKVEDSRVNVYVERFAESENSDPSRDLAKKVASLSILFSIICISLFTATGQMGRFGIRLSNTEASESRQ
jgi:hypothetical protein